MLWSHGPGRWVIQDQGLGEMIMPYSVDQECSYPGCHELVHHGRCKDHPYADRHDAASQRLYDSAQWKRLRALQLAREPWCAACMQSGVYTIATEADHVIPHRGDASLFYTGKLQSLCKYCHSRKTNSELRGGA